MSDITVIVNEYPQQVEVSASIQTGLSLQQQGTQGPAGPGVPAGGATGQLLAKIDNTSFNSEWITNVDGGTFN